jgi:predicted XRE-type DNA-binding protein
MAKSFDDIARKVMTAPQRKRAKELARQDLADMLLSEVRKRRGMSQKELADVLNIRQPSLSKLEAQDDMQVSTLRRIVKALGGRLVITAQFPEGSARIKQFEQRESTKSARTTASSGPRTTAGRFHRSRVTP